MYNVELVEKVILRRKKYNHCKRKTNATMKKEKLA
jgi:hypothetical protein